MMSSLNKKENEETKNLMDQLKKAIQDRYERKYKDNPPQPKGECYDPLDLLAYHEGLSAEIERNILEDLNFLTAEKMEEIGEHLTTCKNCAGRLLDVVRNQPT